jgi:hypothetical protein
MRSRGNPCDVPTVPSVGGASVETESGDYKTQSWTRGKRLMSSLRRFDKQIGRSLDNPLITLAGSLGPLVIDGLN